MSDIAKASVTQVEWHYTKPAVVLHWLLAVLIVGMVGLGWYMMTIEHEPAGPGYINLHKSVGIVVFVLVLLRIIWRLGHKPTALPASLPKWQVVSATIVEWLLYLCMIVLPLTGLLGASYSKSGVAFFGLHLPRWVSANHDQAEQFFGIHESVVWILVALVLVHAAAGVKHLLIDRDRVFQRMWF